MDPIADHIAVVRKTIEHLTTQAACRPKPGQVPRLLAPQTLTPVAEALQALAEAVETLAARLPPPR